MSSSVLRTWIKVFSIGIGIISITSSSSVLRTWIKVLMTNMGLSAEEVVLCVEDVD